MRTLQSLPALVAAALVAATASSSWAHCCHDSNLLGVQERSAFRRGLHGAGDGLTDDSIHASPPSTGRGLGNRNPNSGVGGTGGLRGTGLGNYGAGSVGEPGPGGLGAMKNGGLGGAPPRPR